MKKISIVIPIYNAEKYIIRCLDSIKCQTYKDFEIILINDRSTDHTLEVLDQYKAKNTDIDIIIFTNDKNSGPSVSRNVGVEMSKGDYVFFIDADDDLVGDTALESFIDKTNNDPDIVIGENYFFVNNVLTNTKYHTLENKKETYSGNEILSGFFAAEWASTVWNKLYSKAFLNETNLKFPEGLLHEDELWVFQFSALAKRITFLNKKTYNYYFSNTGSITAGVGLKNLYDYKEILKEKLKFSKEKALYDINEKTEFYIRYFAKTILLSKVVQSGYQIFKEFYLDLRQDFDEYFPKKNEFDLHPLLAYYLYKAKFDDGFFLYGKFPKYINPLLKI